MSEEERHLSASDDSEPLNKPKSGELGSDDLEKAKPET